MKLSEIIEGQLVVTKELGVFFHEDGLVYEMYSQGDVYSRITKHSPEDIEVWGFVEEL